MNKLSYHLILVNSSLRVLADQIEQLCECIEGQVDSNPPPVQLGDQIIYKRHSIFLGDENLKKINKIIKGRNMQSIQNSVYEKIKRSRKGIAFVQIQKRTGFNKKQIANAIYKLKKRNMIVNKKRGIYITSGRSAN